jgi:flagellar motor switch/type III secretory pathway protein FliN
MAGEAVAAKIDEKKIAEKKITEKTVAEKAAAEKTAASAPIPKAGGGAAESESDERWRPVMGLPCELVVQLSVPGFRVKDFLKLRAGSTISADWRVGQDVPLLLNGTLIGWIEFEALGNSMAARLTELA